MQVGRIVVENWLDWYISRENNGEGITGKETIESFEVTRVIFYT